MIHFEELIIDGRLLIKTYSDRFKIRQIETNILYDDAVDIPNKHTYEESDEYLDSITDTEALNIITAKDNE